MYYCLLQGPQKTEAINLPNFPLVRKNIFSFGGGGGLIGKWSFRVWGSGLRVCFVHLETFCSNEFCKPQLPFKSHQNLEDS